MNISFWFGLLTLAVTLGCILGNLFQNLSRNRRLIIAGFVTLLSLVLIPFDTQASIAMYVFAVTGLLSVPLLTTVLCKIAGICLPNHRKRIAIAVVITGLILYLGEIGILPFDLFEYGYNPMYALIFAVIGIVLTDTLGAVVILASYILFVLGIYNNFFSAIVDPILWGGAIVFLIRHAVKKI